MLKPRRSRQTALEAAGSLTLQSCFCLHEVIAKTREAGCSKSKLQECKGGPGVLRDQEAAEEQGQRCGSAVVAPEMAGDVVSSRPQAPHMAISQAGATRPTPGA